MTDEIQARAAFLSACERLMQALVRFYATFAQGIYEARRRVGLSREEFAPLVGLSTRGLIRVERFRLKLRPASTPPEGNASCPLERGRRSKVPTASGS